MKIINQSVELLFASPINLIEKAGRTCYQSGDKITEDSYKKFIKMIVASGHESVLEHSMFTFKIITSRAVTHELVRHRIGVSYSQESQRYVKYDDLEIIQPVNREFEDMELYLLHRVEVVYDNLLRMGYKPEEAREILPNCTKTEIIVTFNARSLRHFLKLRRSHKALPQIKDIADKIMDLIYKDYSVLVDDLKGE